MQIDLGKNPFKKFTKSALVEMLEDAIMTEKERSLPMHKRGKKEKSEKDDATEEQDEESQKTADLNEEMRGKPNPVEMDDEDMSEEAMDELMEEDEEEESKPKKKKKNGTKDS